MHDAADELLALYALGALEGEDLARIERHLAEGCAECSRVLAAYERTASKIAYAVEPASPPASLRERLLDSVEVQGDPRSHAPAPLTFAPRVDAGRTRLRAGPITAAAVLAAAAVIAIVFLTWSLIAAGDRLDMAVREVADLREENRRQSEQIEQRDRLLGAIRDPEVRLTRLSAPGESPAPAIEVYWNPQRDHGVLVARNLPPVAPGRTYELWLLDGKDPIPAATFNPDEMGQATVEIGELASADMPQKFAITVEPAGGSPAPTSDILFVGDFGA